MTCNINGERIVYRKIYAGLSEEIEMRLDNEANQRVGGTSIKNKMGSSS